MVIQMMTDKQKKIYNIIKHFNATNGYSPTIRELCEISGLSSTSTIHNHLKKLCKNGYITYLPEKKRSIRITNAVNTDNVPVLGVITAGTPVIAIENIEGYIPVAENLTRGRETFALKIKGDSMINAGILNGDTVIISHQPTVENGEIAAILIDDSATVKRFFREKDYFILKPENDNYKPIYTDKATVLGKVIAVYREI